VLIVPVSEHAEEDDNKGELDKEQGIRLRFIIVRLNCVKSTYKSVAIAQIIYYKANNKHGI
jgi:hypothetical protein